MSENLVATLLTLGIVAAIFAWPPMLQVVCPACSRLLNRRKLALNQEPARSPFDRNPAN